MVKLLSPSYADLQAEVIRLNKMVESLMDRAECDASAVERNSGFYLFQTAAALEQQVRQRTRQLEAALKENEKINRVLRENERNHRLFLDNSPVCIHEIDMGGKVTSMSKAGLRMLHVQQEQQVIGCSFLNFISFADRARVADLLKRAYQGEIVHFEFHPIAAYLDTLKSCFVPIKNNFGDVLRIMGITEDVTEQKKAEEEIRELAFKDTLTQLPNRRLLHQRLIQTMLASERSRLYTALLFLDLDNFKPLNDHFGHEVGDELLIEVGRRISASVRAMDTVARVGGDEFVVMLNELHCNRQCAVNQAALVAEKIREALAKPYFIQRRNAGKQASTIEHHCSSSIGVALFVGLEVAEQDILKCADVAMYQAKAKGRNAVVFCSRNESS
ncbi:diguanylate cyclase [Agarivorans sp. QJM3NY_25]|uniref:diguanylate cyclase n=1 Tax=Agarivorans sp. QJM3NY_25 TaxID=3421430 RepID=UPI003D7EA7AA